ncbi:MAG: copper resistance protein CopC [Gemmatimonadaceae bacterium]
MPRSFTPRRLLSVALWLMLLPSVASAHTALSRSHPAKDSRLATAPARVTLWFTARPQLGFSSIRLLGPDGEVPMERPTADTVNAIAANIGQRLPPGEYRVQWQTASADGHPIRGEFTFTVLTADGAQAPVPATPVAAGGGDEHADHAPSPEAHLRHSEYRTVRWVEFVALLTILGVLGLRAGVLPTLAARGVSTADAGDRARRLGQSAAGLYLLAAVVRLYTESVAVHGAERALDPDQLLPMLTATTWGFGWGAGVAGAVLVFLGWKLSKSRDIGTPVVITGALGLAMSPALSGHAAGSTPALLGIALDVLHVTAAGLWIGGLLLVVIAGIPAMRRLPEDTRDSAVAGLVNAFHPLALLCAPLVVLTGLGSSWLRLGNLSNLWATAYGVTLLWKLALFVMVVGLGLYNSLRARRRLGMATATRHVRLSASAELFFAALVLAATMTLIVTPVPSDMIP